jgi:hypothetical protein
MSLLHTYSDGSKLITLSAKELISIPTWKGNRILDLEHAGRIKAAIASDVKMLDSNYSIIQYVEPNVDGAPVVQRYLIDGQHRASVVRDFFRDTLCEPDFTVTVREKTVESESDAVDYFNAINNVKRQYWKTDPMLIVNRYIQEIERFLNTNTRSPLVRCNGKRPYLSSDRLREGLLKYAENLKSSDEELRKFLDGIVRENDIILKSLEVESLSNGKNRALIERTIHIQFALAYYSDLPWIGRILNIKRP